MYEQHNQFSKRRRIEYSHPTIATLLIEPKIVQYNTKTKKSKPNTEKTRKSFWNTFSYGIDAVRWITINILMFLLFLVCVLLSSILVFIICFVCYCRRPWKQFRFFLLFLSLKMYDSSELKWSKQTVSWLLLLLLLLLLLWEWWWCWWCWSWFYCWHSVDRLEWINIDFEDIQHFVFNRFSFDSIIIRSLSLYYEWIQFIHVKWNEINRMNEWMNEVVCL